MNTHMLKKLTITAVATLAIGTMIAGCGSDNDSKQAAAGQKVIHVGTNATFVPFEFNDEKTQDLNGFDIDMIKAVAQHMNAKVEFKNVSFDALIPSLGNKDIDLAASGMTITKARAEKVLFSSPYYESGLGVVVPANANINTLQDLNGKTVSAQMGTTGADMAKKIEGVTLKQFDHSNEALLELKNGGVAAAVIDLPVAQYYVSKHKDEGFKVIPFPNTKEYFGFAMNQNNKELQAEVNKALAEMKKSGEFNTIYKKWFNTDAPADMPTEWQGK